MGTACGGSAFTDTPAAHAASQGDVSRTSQIIQNLGARPALLPAAIHGNADASSALPVTNALKFCRGSLVEVTTRMEVEPAARLPLTPPLLPRPLLCVDVADRGVGLTAADCDRIFLPYEHAAAEKARPPHAFVFLHV